jgi:hypothetical protein
MNIFATLLIASFLAGITTVVSASPQNLEHEQYQRLVGTLGSDLFSKKNKTFARNYSKTQCIDIYLKRTREKAGFICATRTKEFISEMGIIEYDALPINARPNVRPKSGLIISTPIAQYELSSLIDSESGANFAVIDCDITGEAIYRPNGSCHVVVSALDSSEIFYSNFVVQNHVSKKQGIPQNRIEKVWRTLKAR